MDNDRVVEQLRDLISDRKSFLTDDEAHDHVFLYDIEALELAIAVLARQAEPKLRALTVEDAPDMEGLPVWVEHKQVSEFTGYYIVSNNDQGLYGANGLFLEFDKTQKKYDFYDHQPKEAANE